MRNGPAFSALFARSPYFLGLFDHPAGIFEPSFCISGEFSNTGLFCLSWKKIFAPFQPWKRWGEHEGNSLAHRPALLLSRLVLSVAG
jgi:hypothetical protein